MSDNLIIVTMLGYLAAMLVHAAHYAFGRQGVATKVLAGAGGPSTTVTEPVDTAPAPSNTGLARIALVVTGFAALAHLATTVLRFVEAGQFAPSNMYEFVLLVTLVGALVWLGVVLYQPAVVHLGLFVTLILVLLTGIAAVVLRRPVAPLMPALDSYWKVIHVGAASIASALFLVGFAASIMYLLRSGYDAGKRGGLYPYGKYLAGAEAVERLSFRLHAFGFPIWTFAVAAGAVWAEAAWGRYWGWDPKETWAFISWVVYACYLHARATPSVRRDITAWIAILGWATMMMNLFGVNIFYDNSVHSYGGV